MFGLGPLSIWGYGMSKTAGKAKSTRIKEDLAKVRITARVGRLPIVSDSEKFLAPGVPLEKVPGVVLEFGNEGVCELDPVHDAKTIKVFREWIEDGRDERIAECGVLEIAADALLPPFPAWDVTDAGKCVEMVGVLGLDPEHALRYELGKGDEARSKVVKALEARVDTPEEVDPLEEPEL